MDKKGVYVSKDSGVRDLGSIGQLRVDPDLVDELGDSVEGGGGCHPNPLKKNTKKTKRART